ncbi:MAG: hypothetical protein AAGF58_11290 [Pseudomonadota bacterium]
MSDRIPPSVVTFWDEASRRVHAILERSPLAGMLLFAIVVGTLFTAFTSVIAPRKTPMMSSYDFVQDFFEQRADYEFTYQDKLVELAVQELDAGSSRFISPSASAEQASLRIRVDYPIVEAAVPIPLTITLLSESSGQDDEEVFSSSFLPNQMPLLLEVSVPGETLKVQLTRSEQHTGSPWPSATIAVAGVTDD